MQAIKSTFIPWLKDLETTTTQDGDNTERISEALSLLKKHIDTNYKRPEGMYSKVRQIIGKEIPDSYILKRSREIIRMSKDEYEACNAAQRKVTEMRNAKQTVFSLDYVNSVVDRLRPCTTFADRFCFLQLACGARCVELLDCETSRFVIPMGSSNLIQQIGFAKKKKEDARNTVVKPLLWTSPRNFVAQLHLLREEVKSREHQSRRDIAKSFSTRLGGLCRHMWRQNSINGYRTGTHINRAIYANVAYKSRGNAGESLTYFIKHVLGHDAMGSASNYMNVAIAFSEEEKLMKEAERQEAEDDPATVTMSKGDGTSVTFRLPPIRRMTPEQRESDLILHAKQLRARGVTVNRRNLVALGFQSKAISKAFLREFALDK